MRSLIPTGEQEALLLAFFLGLGIGALLTSSIAIALPSPPPTAGQIADWQALREAEAVYTPTPAPEASDEAETVH